MVWTFTALKFVHTPILSEKKNLTKCLFKVDLDHLSDMYFKIAYIWI